MANPISSRSFTDDSPVLVSAPSPVGTVPNIAIKRNPADRRIIVNGRFRAHRITGVQRYAEELSRRLAPHVSVLEPRRHLKGAVGHLWEQFALPVRARSGVLWSPCNTGPVSHPRHVVTVHDLFTLEHPEWFSGAFAKGYRMITPALLRNARHVIAVSEFTKRQVVTLTGVDSDKVTVIYNGIGPQFAPQTETDIRAARAAIGLPSGAYFLSVASLEPRKNVARILKAWAKALPHIPEHYSLVLAGSAESIFASLDLNEIPPRVVFPGYVADQHLPALYAGARAFVFPSLAEGFGLPPLEAMACGTAVLTSDSSALSEVTGTAGYTVDPTNIHAIAAGMVDLATNDILCDTLQQKGRAQAARFCWTRAASQTLAVLEKEVAAQ